MHIHMYTLNMSMSIMYIQTYRHMYTTTHKVTHQHIYIILYNTKHMYIYIVLNAFKRLTKGITVAYRKRQVVRYSYIC